MQTKTRISSMAARFLSSSAFLNLQRNKARLARKISGNAPAVNYFHQIDDPYSHLCVQKLDQLTATYNLPFKVHLVSKPSNDYQGSSDHFDAWAIRDALSIAQDYGTVFETPCESISTQTLDRANNLLAQHLDSKEFARQAFDIGKAYWHGDTLPAPSGDLGLEAVAKGNTRRQKLGHYAGGMFYFEGEWFWGIDRIRVLEQRLTNEGFKVANNIGGQVDSSVESSIKKVENKINSTRFCVPEPTPKTLSRTNQDVAAAAITLEYFPSLRSPYTAIGHQRVLDMIKRTGVKVLLRPVMPMLMRGIPAPFKKKRYIIQDSGREARFRNIPFGNIVDPFGEPVKRAFALFPAAMKLGKGMEFVGEYLAASWATGLDITNDTGLKLIAANAGIDWLELQQARQDTDWQAVLDDNLEAMLEAGLWGVPSFRVSGGGPATEPYSCWGQDRIWRVENEIVNRIQNGE